MGWILIYTIISLVIGVITGIFIGIILILKLMVKKLEDWVMEDPIESFCHFLAVQGYIPPRNEEELLEFEELHKDYVPRIKGMHVDVDKIINGEIKCEWLWKC